jgi:long-chain acyl-CoA synthetase
VEKIWLKQYDQGVSETINEHEFESLNDMFDNACKKHASNTAYINMGVKLSYADIESKTQAFAAGLQSLGLKPGDRVAIMMPNLLQYPVALFGILRAGLVVVNTNPLYTADELVHQMNDSGAKAIIVLANFAKTVEMALPRMQLKHVIITEIGDLFPFFKRTIVNFVVKHVKKMVRPYDLPSQISFNQLLKTGETAKLSPVRLNRHDIAFLQYTGGTTGVAKGAILTHHNMICNVLQAAMWLTPLRLGEPDIVVTALPLYHIFSLTANCLTFLNEGSQNILITNPRDISTFIKDIKNTKFTAITGVNTLFNALLNHPDFEKVDFSKVKLALSGGMALQKSVSIRWKTKTKTRVLEAYGLTETSPAVTMNPMSLEDYNGSIGLPLPSTNISIRDDEGKEVPLGESGELCVQGPQVTQGYWQRPDETALVFTDDGFLKTGDVAKVDEQGYVYLVDRKKDLILVSGFNVYPNEVEQVIGMHPGVLEVGVVGVQDEEHGELVKACIVKKDPALTAEEVIAHCKTHLTPYKVPKIILFYNDLPKTNVGKILRRALRD